MYEPNLYIKLSNAWFYTYMHGCMHAVSQQWSTIFTISQDCYPGPKTELGKIVNKSSLGKFSGIIFEASLIDPPISRMKLARPLG